MSTTLKEVCLNVAIAVEISAAKWVVASYGGGAGSIRRKVLSEQMADKRLEALVQEVAEVCRRLGAGEQTRVVVAYEAGQEGFWLVRALRARGIKAEVIDPVSLQVDRRARRAKTDRLDAEALVRSLCGGWEATVWPCGWCGCRAWPTRTIANGSASGTG